MLNQKAQNIKEFFNLIDILEKNKIWYSLFAGSLLGADALQKMIPWDDDIDILISYEGYQKLLQLYPKQVVKSNDKGYPLIFPKWVSDKTKIAQSSIFVDLFIVVPSSKENIKKWRGIRNQLRFSTYMEHNNFRPFTLNLWLLKIWTWPLKFFYKKQISVEQAYKQLYSDKAQCHYYIENPTLPPRINTIEHFSPERVSINFEGRSVLAIKNYKLWLKYRYGKLNKPPIGKKVNEHTNVYNIKQVKYQPGKV